MNKTADPTKLANPNMALNGRFPTAVGDFKYEINR
jgi:hypothetical protein